MKVNKMNKQEQKRLENNIARTVKFAYAVVQSPTQKYLLNTHNCALCGKAVTDYEEYKFMESTGMCGSCDHMHEEYIEGIEPEEWDGEDPRYEYLSERDQ